MIDELELSFEERADKGRHRRGARRKPKKGRGGKSAVALLVTLLLLGGLAGGVWYGFDRIQGLFTVADYDGTGRRGRSRSRPATRSPTSPTR